jgi:hypothetical protein
LVAFISVVILYTLGRTPWTRVGGQTVAKPLSTRKTTQTQTSMSRVKFEPTISVSERAKAVHAFDRVETVIGHLNEHILNSS